MSTLVEDVRDWVGSTPDRTTILATLRRFGQNPWEAARAILRRRLADLEADYATFKVDGDAAWSHTTDQMDAIRAKIARLDRLCGDAEDPTAALPTVTSVTTLPGASAC